MIRLSSGLMALAFAQAALAQVSPSESKHNDSLDASRALVLMKPLSEDVVSNRSGAGAGSAVSGQPRPLDVDLYDVYRETSSPEAPARLAKLEAQAEAYLREALFIVSGRLEKATRALSQTPIPRGGTE